MRLFQPEERRSTATADRITAADEHSSGRDMMRKWPWLNRWAALGERMLLPGFGQGEAKAMLPAGPGYERVPLRTLDGTNIVAKFGRALDSFGDPLLLSRDAPTVLFFYGRSMTIRRDLGVFDYFRRMGANVLIPEFPGYGMSEGRASERGCYATADAAFEYLIRRAGVARDRLVFAGWSLGTGTAVDLASRQRVAGLLLAGAITSACDLGRERLPWGARWLSRALSASCRFENLAKIPAVSCPILLLHGTHDPLVPYWMTERLSRAARTRTAVLPVEGAKHHNVWRAGAKPLWSSVRQWLREVMPSTDTPLSALFSSRGSDGLMRERFHAKRRPCVS